MACIIPRRPWQPPESPRPAPAAGELSCDEASKHGRVLMLSVRDVLSGMLGSTPFRQLMVLRRLRGGVACTSVACTSAYNKRRSQVIGSDDQSYKETVLWDFFMFYWTTVEVAICL